MAFIDVVERSRALSCSDSSDVSSRNCGKTRSPYVKFGKVKLLSRTKDAASIPFEVRCSSKFQKPPTGKELLARKFNVRLVGKVTSWNSEPEKMVKKDAINMVIVDASDPMCLRPISFQMA